MSLLRTTPRPVPAPTDPASAPHLSLWHYMSPIRFRWFLGVLVAMAASITAITIPQVLAWIVDHLVGAAHPTATNVWFGGFLMIGLGLLQAGFIFMRRMLVIDTAAQIEGNIRMALFDQLMRVPVSFHDRWPSGQLLTRSTSDLSLMRRWIAFGSIQSISSATMVLVGLIFLFRGSVQLGIIYLCAVPFMLLTMWLFIRRMKALTRLSQQQSGDLATTVEESVQGIRVLKALGQGKNALGRFSTQSAELKTTEISRSKTLGNMFVKNSAITGLAMAISLFVGIHQVAQGHLSVGALTAYFATTAILTPQIERSGMLLSMWLDSKVAMERHREIMQEPVGENIVLVSGATTPHNDAREAASLEFRNAAFTYDDATQPVIRDLSLAIKPGEILALVGTTGSGKSTLLQLVPRLYSLTAGALEIDGRNVNDIDLPTLRSYIAVAFEEPVLFSSSVRDNVLLGVPTEEKTEEELENILRTALHVSSSDFVDELPDGVNTRVGEEGMSLSGGQRQRLSLARAIAGHPRVLLLDDPLSALDVNTEETVVRRLKEQLTATTTLITAHRPSTVTLADRVALLEDGHITAVGTHSELMSNPAYAKLMVLNAPSSMNQEAR